MTKFTAFNKRRQRRRRKGVDLHKLAFWMSLMSIIVKWWIQKKSHSLMHARLYKWLWRIFSIYLTHGRIFKFAASAYLTPIQYSQYLILNSFPTQWIYVATARGKRSEKFFTLNFIAHRTLEYLELEQKRKSFFH